MNYNQIGTKLSNCVSNKYPKDIFWIS